MIAIDALRADHMSSFGYDRRTTPILDGLAAQGVAFTSTWSASPDVLAAHAGILTGCDPKLAQRPNVKITGPESELASWFIPDSLPRLSQHFLAHGFETAAFVDHPAISQVHGFAKGFQNFHAFREENSSQAEVGFDGVAARFVNWLGSRDVSQDWFAYMHIDDLERLWSRSETDPHWDTFFESRPELARVPPVADGEHVFFAVPRGRWSGGTLSLGEYEARYDGALLKLDGKIKNLLETLRRRGRLEFTTVVIVGTFGLSLGESGLYVDSGTLSDTDLHVPLIIRPALRFQYPRSHKTHALASTIDVAPTLLDMYGLPIPKGMQGVSQLSILAGSDEPVRTVTFASGGLQDGTVAIDAGACFERSFPGRGRDQRADRSWYGDAIDHAAEARTYLHDRKLQPSPGHLPASSSGAQVPSDASAPSDPEVTARLSRAALDWYAWIDAARKILHSPSTARTGESARVAEELERRGLTSPAR